MLDAHRGEVYGSVYDPAGAIVQREIVGKFEAWFESLPAGAEILSPDYVSSRVEIVRTPRELASAIARIAPSDACNPAAIDANYVRRSDAELFWKER